MTEVLKIGRALYEADYQTKAYWYYGTKPNKVRRAEEDRNKRKINGFTRILRDGRTKKSRHERG